MDKKKEPTFEVSRRDFLKTSSTIGLAAALSSSGHVFAAGSDRIRVGVIGCGGRGTGAAINCVESSKNVEIVAMADLFKDHLDNSYKRLKDKLPAESFKVKKSSCFVGFDAYKKVLNEKIDMVIMAPPPQFRPIHLKASIAAGKHVFMEKPVAVDPVGIRSVLATSKLASEKGLAIVAGTQRRHQAHYLEVMKRIHGGDIGKLISGQCYWNQGALWLGRVKSNMERRKFEKWTEMEFQIRQWLFYDWLSGDHIVEQHVHNIDVINWAMGGPPVKCSGMGGRQVRTGKEFGNVFDHFAVEYEYANGARVMSMCRQTAGCTSNVSERVLGSMGNTHTSGSMARIFGTKPYEYKEEGVNPYVQEHTDLIASIRKGSPLNEGKTVAESTMTAIMGRISAYTGRALNWDWVMNASKLDLSPPKYELGDCPIRSVSIPGETKLV